MLATSAATAGATSHEGAGVPSPCAHCGLPVPTALHEDGARAQFCCGGCRAVFEILHDHGLDRYYEFAERRTTPVVRTGRSYDEFDHPDFHELYVQRTADGLSRVHLYLEGVHCASCVWLVERVPLVLPGVVRAELHVGRSQATLEWDAIRTPLSEVARFLESLGYVPHPYRGIRAGEVRRAEDRVALTRIGIAGAIAINVMLPALAMYSGWLSAGIEADFERFFRWTSLILTVPAILGPGRVFFTGAWGALRTRSLHLDVPIAIALAAGFVRGAVNTVTDTGPIYFDGVSVLIFLLLIGRFLQQRSQRAAAAASELLSTVTPNGARMVDEQGVVREIPATALLPGMTMDVRAGETLAADGVVVDGQSTLDLSLLTGEPRPVSVDVGANVYAGTLNVAAPLRVRVVRSGESSRVARLLQQVEQSARRRAPIVLLANRMAGVFVIVTLVLALATYVLWYRDDATRALDHAIALLVVTCPCALAMATPLAVTVAAGRAARRGIFVKGGDALESLSRPGLLFIDKTGTITEGRSSLLQWHGEESLKPLVLSLEQGSTHPLAEGFRQAFAGLETPPVESSTHVPGGGIRGRVLGHDVVIGSPSFVSSAATGATSCREMHGDPAYTPVWIAVDGVVRARAAFGDAIRVDARESLDRLRAQGWRVRMLSGDVSDVARAVGSELGLAVVDCMGEMSPEAKLRQVAEARAADPGRTVVMVGDGVNDAAAMAAATVGIAVHGGAEASLATADVYLTTPGLSVLVELSAGAANTMRVIRRNIAFSLAYNVLGVGLAITGVINPLLGAIMMPMSSLTVVLGSWLGRTFPRVS
ncbi:MAG: putative copper-importing P-type ATPase A [Gemmatimonadaceae bacterium]|nr:putative copper-importing P-type ATPase A [Gemmatimonadaceae bacterium]